MTPQQAVDVLRRQAWFDERLYLREICQAAVAAASVTDDPPIPGDPAITAWIIERAAWRTLERIAPEVLDRYAPAQQAVRSWIPAERNSP